MTMTLRDLSRPIWSWAIPSRNNSSSLQRQPLRQRRARFWIQALYSAALAAVAFRAMTLRLAPRSPLLRI